MEDKYKLINRILLGLVMLIPGLIKLFVSKPAGIQNMLSNIFLFAWAPLFWAWILILSEICFGIAILANFRLKYTTIPPIIILSVAVLFVTINWKNFSGTPWSSVLLHLIAISGFVILNREAKN